MRAFKFRLGSRSLVLGTLFAMIAGGIVLCGFTAIGLAYFFATLPLVVRA